MTATTTQTEPLVIGSTVNVAGRRGVWTVVDIMTVRETTIKDVLLRQDTANGTRRLIRPLANFSR